MNDQIFSCCKNTPSFLITYKVGSKFYVCNSCIQMECWSRGIQEKLELTKLEGRSVLSPSSSTPLAEVIGIGK